MTNSSCQLDLTKKAIAISPSAVHLTEQMTGVEQAIANNENPLIIDRSKTMLETTLKTILKDNNSSAKDPKSLTSLYSSVKNLVIFNTDKAIDEIFKKMGGSITHALGELRNSYGIASHGSDAYSVNPLGTPEVEMMVSAVDGLVACLWTKHKSQFKPSANSRIHYEDNPEFNNWLDDQSDGCRFDDSVYLVSEILFKIDLVAYRERLIEYSSSEGGELEVLDA